MRIKSGRRRSPELDIHYAIVKALNNHGTKGIPYYHPASGEKRALATAVRLKRMGVIRGIPDLCFVLPPNGRAAYLELKAPKGVVSPDQKLFRDAVRAVGGQWECAWSFDQAWGVLSAWGVLPRDVGYSAHDDLSNSVDFCYDEIRERVADGGEGWPK